jgi:peptidoglycan/LPS O-acetylase OafA/YrhL
VSGEFEGTALPPRYPLLDALRGVAILWVLAHQLCGLESLSGPLAFLFEKAAYLGWMGVQLFFVLSGFLITGILLDTRGAKNYWSGFMARRALRIFPLYFGVLAITFWGLPAIGVSGAMLEHDRAHQIWLWTYLSNWVEPHGLGSDLFPHFWSLAIEEQFYLVWPLLLWNATAQRAWRIALATIGLSVAARGAMVAWDASPSALYHYSVARMDALAMGGAVAALVRMPDGRRWLVARAERLLPWALVIFLAGALPTRAWSTANAVGQIAGYTLSALVFALLVARVVSPGAGGAGDGIRRLHDALSAVGKVSYAMYVFHKPMHQFIGKPALAALGLSLSTSVAVNAAYIVAGSAVVFAAAWLSWHLFEKHVLALKRRFEPRY